MAARTALIGIDWGTTSFRASRMGADGAVLASRSAKAGILRVDGGAFAATFEREIGPWLAEAPAVPVIASGMITSRQGWVEVPYCACPAGAAELAAGLLEHTTASGRAIHFVPGLAFTGADGVPDVIRGEETQILGVAATAERRLMVLPGTHSKWVLVEGGRITWFATFMTGELFAVLKDHSILGRLMAEGGADAGAFARGLAYAKEDGGGLLKRLFSARTLGLFDQLEATAIADYLSGLLIGTEIGEALACLEGPQSDAVTVVGASALAERYVAAIEAAGLVAARAPEDAAARGQHRIARAAGLIR